jgi:serine/threonine protein kinase
MSGRKSSSPSLIDPRLGTILQGRYSIRSQLAMGAMSTVYRGARLGVGRPVAIKFLRPAVAAQEAFFEPAGEQRGRAPRGARAAPVPCDPATAGGAAALGHATAAAKRRDPQPRQVLIVATRWLLS